MFSLLWALRARFFVAGVQAEIKAQYSDQAFVNAVCQTRHQMEQLAILRHEAYWAKHKMGHFIAACIALADGMTEPELTQEQQLRCGMLLAQRLEKLSGNQSLRLQYISVFGDLEQRLQAWSAADHGFVAT